MKKRYIALIALLILVLFSTTSNPSKSEYVSWVKEEFQEEGGILFTMFAGPFLNSSTTKRNYGVFSLYNTKVSEEENLKAIGFLNNFYWLQGSPENKANASSPDDE